MICGVVAEVDNEGEWSGIAGKDVEEIVLGHEEG